MEQQVLPKIKNLFLLAGFAGLGVLIGSHCISEFCSLMLLPFFIFIAGLELVVLFKKHFAWGNNFLVQYPNWGLWLQFIGVWLIFNLPKGVIFLTSDCQNDVMNLYQSVSEIYECLIYISGIGLLLFEIIPFLQGKKKLCLNTKFSKDIVFKKIHYLLLFGGIMKILSSGVYFFAESVRENIFTTTFSSLFIPCLVWGTILLLVIKQFALFDKFANHFPKITVFLKWIGVIPYLDLPIYVFTMVVGYEYVLELYNLSNNQIVNCIELYSGIVQYVQYGLYAGGVSAFFYIWYRQRKKDGKNNIILELINLFFDILP